MKIKDQTILIATRNPAKENRYRDIFGTLSCKVLGLKDVVTRGKPDENGQTAEENAEIKARFYARQTDHMVFAEDEALYVDFLPSDHQPGVHVRRINGKDEASDDQLLAYWEQVIANTLPDRRTGKWHVAYCIARPDGWSKTFALDFPVLFFSPSSPIKIPGWPMSSLEGPMHLKKPSSEMTDQEHLQAHNRLNQLLEKMLAEIDLLP